jgi:hypothetical protein
LRVLRPGVAISRIVAQSPGLRAAHDSLRKYALKEAGKNGRDIKSHTL